MRSGGRQISYFLIISCYRLDLASTQRPFRNLLANPETGIVNTLRSNPGLKRCNAGIALMGFRVATSFPGPAPLSQVVKTRHHRSVENRAADRKDT
jgi:hypothetical protein